MKKLTEEQIQYIKDNYDTEDSTNSISKIASLLNRTFGGVKAKIYNMGLLRSTRYTKEDILFIRENYDNKDSAKSIKYIAKELGRTVKAIQYQVWELGLRGVNYE